MATLTYLPSVSSKVDRQAKVAVTGFGDGYAQRVRSGLNSMPRTWALTFDGLSIAASAGIEGFFDAHAQGQPFDWTPPVGPAGRWVCESWDKNYGGFNKRSITATLEEDFAP